MLLNIYKIQKNCTVQSTLSALPFSVASVHFCLIPTILQKTWCMYKKPGVWLIKVRAFACISKQMYTKLRLLWTVDLNTHNGLKVFAKLEFFCDWSNQFTHKGSSALTAGGTASSQFSKAPSPQSKVLTFEAFPKPQQHSFMTRSGSSF